MEGSIQGEGREAIKNFLVEKEGDGFFPAISFDPLSKVKGRTSSSSPPDRLSPSSVSLTFLPPP
jgi:hypothetical protein